jgi:hypothetical protein
MPSITPDYQWFAGKSEDESLLISSGIVMVTDETVILPHTLLVRPASNMRHEFFFSGRHRRSPHSLSQPIVREQTGIVHGKV